MNRECQLGIQARLLVLVALLLICGCERREPVTPTSASIPLRVVMFVETGADLDNPTTTTGGCRLTQSQVRDLVQELIQFAPNYCPGLKFTWDETIFMLESDCMAVLPWPFPPCTSQCGDVPFQDNCPRNMTDVWFQENVVNQGPGGPAALQQHDDWNGDQGPLGVINIYFVGNALIGPTQAVGFGYTIPINPYIEFYVLINDAALVEADAPGDAQRQHDRATLLHEVGHWLKMNNEHPNVPPGECPRNLMISGLTFDACFDEYGGRRPREVLEADRIDICENLGIQP